jgi:hypothetical protein
MSKSFCLSHKTSVSFNLGRRATMTPLLKPINKLGGLKEDPRAPAAKTPVPGNEISNNQFKD